jgi:hypothetical protein
VDGFEEPVISDPPPPGTDPGQARRFRMMPLSVAFLLTRRRGRA